MVLDRGLQPERTALAWSRTTLAVVVGGLVATRLLGPVLGGWGVALGAAGTAAGGVLALAARRRVRRVAVALRAGGVVPPAGGLLLLLATTVATGAGVAAVALSR